MYPIICALAWPSDPNSVQGDSTVKHVKDLDVVLGADKAVVILDETAGVWPSHQRNLLQVLRYRACTPSH